MIASLLIKNRCKIELNNKGKFGVHNQNLSGQELSFKDVPLVRFDIGEYTQEDVQYINEMMKKFSVSTPVIQVRLDEKIVNNVNIVNCFEKIAKLLYINVNDTDVLNKGLSAETMQLVGLAASAKWDRVIIVDKTLSMTPTNVIPIIEQLSYTFGVSMDNIGICESPLSFNGRGCMPAVVARELMSMYGPDADNVPVPSANHQDKYCGCIQYIVIEQDTVVIPDTTGNKKDKAPKKVKEPSEQKEKKESSKSKKKVNVVSMQKYNF